MGVGFPGLAELNRRTIRAPVNPMDKTTVVSIYPREIHEQKVTVEPGIFHIPAGTYENPSVLVVGPSSWWKEIDENQPLLEIPINSIQIADALINDWAKGLVACDMGESKPGLFYVPGEITAATVQKNFKHLLDIANRRQKTWFQATVKIADILWTRTQGNPLAISEDARIAARMLNLNNKPWLQDYQTAELSNCHACGNLINPQYPVCSNCKAIVNEERAKALNIKFAM